ncbi:hypothetical protein [Azotobacter beijerinckii]|uniref:hypothetical protein n=1 Tax=Azotobacter beijerinckii TaxID=170623 RepID=UPI000B81456D|nr:hypothetical protein [Azotobacter beijerinckii]
MEDQELNQQASIKVCADVNGALEELRSLSATLKQVFEDAPGLGLKVYQLLFGADDRLLPGLIEFHGVAASGADGLSVSLHITDRFKEIFAAAAAGDLKRLGING